MKLTKLSWLYKIQRLKEVNNHQKKMKLQPLQSKLLNHQKFKLLRKKSKGLPSSLANLLVVYLVILPNTNKFKNKLNLGRYGKKFWLLRRFRHWKTRKKLTKKLKSWQKLLLYKKQINKPHNQKASQVQESLQANQIQDRLQVSICRDRPQISKIKQRNKLYLNLVWMISLKSGIFLHLLEFLKRWKHRKQQ